MSGYSPDAAAHPHQSPYREEPCHPQRTAHAYDDAYADDNMVHRESQQAPLASYYPPQTSYPYAQPLYGQGYWQQQQARPVTQPEIQQQHPPQSAASYHSYPPQQQQQQPLLQQQPQPQPQPLPALPPVLIPAVLPPASHKRPTLPDYPLPPPGVIPPYSFGGHVPNALDNAAPKVGQTRCYWTLLSSQLTFVYLDPVLQLHMGPQAPHMATRCILDFVHPDEVDNAREDLDHVLRYPDHMGSVTRVRFLRLSAIRTALGASRGDLAPWKDQERIAFDNNYMALDLVITWVAEGLLLCFIHAIVDLSKADNDESLKTPWTNWCGGALMDERYAAGMTQAIATPYLMDPPYSPFPRQHTQSPSQNPHVSGSGYSPHSPSTTVSSSTTARSSSLNLSEGHGHQEHPSDSSISRPTSMPDKIFQVLQNDDSRRVMCSYPSTGYDPEDLGQVARGVSMTASGGGQALPKTNCTRRLENVGAVVDRQDGRLKTLHSVYIPHGSVIFACHNLEQGDAQTEEPRHYHQHPLVGQDMYNQAPPPYTQDHPRQRSHEVSAGSSAHLEQGSPYMPYRAHPSVPYPSHIDTQNPTSSNQYAQYPSTWSSNHQQGSYGPPPPAPAQPKYAQSIPSHSRTSGAPPNPLPEYSHHHSLQPARSSQSLYPTTRLTPPALHTLPGGSSATGMPGSHPHGTYPQESQWSAEANTWGPEGSGSATETPSGGIDGLPLPPPLDVLTPVSASTSHSLGDYPTGYASAGPTSAPPNGQSYFPIRNEHSHGQSHSILTSPAAVVKRSSDDMLYGSESPSTDDRSISPHRRQPLPHPPQLLRHHSSYGGPSVYDDYRSYEDASGITDRPPSPRDDGRAGTAVHSLISTHREPCGSRTNGNPPPGVTKCESCGTENSPEWRKGASGIKNLCNACGLRFARSKQKKEGVLPQRRKKKEKSNAPVTTKGKKPTKSRRIEESPSPVLQNSISPPSDESKPLDVQYYPHHHPVDTYGRMLQQHETYNELPHYHAPPQSASRSHFPLTPVSIDDQGPEYGGYARPQG